VTACPIFGFTTTLRNLGKSFVRKKRQKGWPVDTWSYFKDGKLIRRDVDTKQQGRPDTVYYYDGDKLAEKSTTRPAKDVLPTAPFTRRALGEGREGSQWPSRPDLWVYYDTAREGETVIKEERDLNGDGLVDLWTYYESGRLVRRMSARSDSISLPNRADPFRPLS